MFNLIYKCKCRHVNVDVYRDKYRDKYMYKRQKGNFVITSLATVIILFKKTWFMLNNNDWKFYRETKIKTNISKILL